MKHQQIFKTITGSRAYGTHIETSDWDYKGVYLQHNHDILGFSYKPQTEKGKDEVNYEIKRCLELLATANPSMLEMLFMPDQAVMHSSVAWESIREYKHRFLTKKCLNSFGGYAVQQIQKAKGLDKKMNYEKERIERKTPFHFCYVVMDGKTLLLEKYLQQEKLKQEHCGLMALDHFKDCYALYYDYSAEFGPDSYRGVLGKGYRGISVDDGNQLRLSDVPKGERSIATISYNKDAYTIHCKDFNEYNTWLENRNTQRYVDTQTHGQKIDGKNLLHCRRLLDMAYEIASRGKLIVERSNAKDLLKIRRGEVVLEQVIEQAEHDIKQLDIVYANCTLPDEVDPEFVNDLLISTRNKFGNFKC